VSVDSFKKNDSPAFFITDPMLFPPINHSTLYLCMVPASIFEVKVAGRFLYSEKSAGPRVPSQSARAVAGRITLRVRTANKEITTILLKISRELVGVFATNVGRFFLLIFFIVTLNHCKCFD